MIRWDRRAFAALTRRRDGPGDRVYHWLTLIGTRSAVWMAVAAGLAGVGGRKGKRAASETMAAVGLSSLAANVVVKLLVRRRRPASLLPLTVRTPRSRSFPSGHTATSFAAATVIGARYRPLAPPAYALAAGVGLSRVHLGVHYPLDVLAGAVLGTAVGAGVVQAQRPSTEQAAHLRDLRRRPLSAGSRAGLVVNPQAGGDATDGLPDEVVVRPLQEGEDLEAALEELVGRGVDVLGVAGGDGSVGCAARVAARADLPLWVVPAGTLNHFALALGLPDEASAVQALDEGFAARVDLGMAGPHAFVNNASFGIYAELVERRERYEDAFALGKWPAALLALAITLRRAEPLEITIDGRPERAFLVFVGSDPYRGTHALGGRGSLQEGLLDLRVLRARGRWPRAGLVAAMVTGRLVPTRRLVRRLVPALSVSLSEPALLAHDGEVEEVKGEVEFRSLPAAVAVVVPAPER